MKLLIANSDKMNLIALFTVIYSNLLFLTFEASIIFSHHLTASNFSFALTLVEEEEEEPEEEAEEGSDAEKEAEEEKPPA